jgi:hypothetical protein
MPKMGRFGLLIGKAKVNNTPKKTTAQGGKEESRRSGTLKASAFATSLGNVMYLVLASRG